MSKANNIASLLNSSGLLDSDDIATNAITNSKIASGAIDSDAIGTDAITAAKLNIGQVGGRRNIIHNGAFTVDQRATPVTLSNGTNKTVDRWRCNYTNFDNATVVMQQSTTVPSGAGFGNSLQFNVTGTETSLEADEHFWVGHFIEGQNLQHLAHNTSSAKKITLSFWVRSHVAGDYGILLYKFNAARGYTTSYTINAVDTWEYKTITIDGDTSGAILNDNSTQLGIYWSLGNGTDNKGGGTAVWSGFSTNQFTISGQTNILSATGSWYLTGVQLELGDTATPFEHRSYGEELALCQRYFVRYSGGQFHRLCFGFNDTTSRQQCVFSTPTELRAIPTLSETNLTMSGGVDVSTISGVQKLNGGRIFFALNSSTSPFTTGAINQAYWDQTSGNTFDVNAEL